MAEKKIVNIAPNEEETMEDVTEQEQETPEQPPKDEPKDEPKVTKEFILIRGIKAVGRGIAKTGKAINGFAHEHPIPSCVISAGLGVAAKIGWDYLTGDRAGTEEVHEAEEETPMLTEYEPEPECNDEHVQEAAEEVVSTENVTEE